MVLNVCGIVKRAGRVIANGIDGKFETDDLAVIEHLKSIGFKEIEQESKEEPMAIEPKDEQKPEPKRKLGRTKSKGSK